MTALAVVLTAMSRLRSLQCGSNPIGEVGWLALVGALPQMPVLRTLDACECTGMGDLTGSASSWAVAMFCAPEPTHQRMRC